MAAGYVNAAFGTFFARQWARRYRFGVTVADAMFRFVAPAMLVQVLLMIPPTAIYFVPPSTTEDIWVLILYSSIPWRVQQVVVLGLMTWTVRRRPLVEGGAETPVVPLAFSVPSSFRKDASSLTLIPNGSSTR
ncbi:hypothetical protein EXIGLDRAFT_719378, partial [Exidia glandulosa HHB12029]